MENGRRKEETILFIYFNMDVITVAMVMLAVTMGTEIVGIVVHTNKGQRDPEHYGMENHDGVNGAVGLLKCQVRANANANTYCKTSLKL